MISKKFQEWIKLKKPCFYIYEESEEHFLAFGFKNKGYIADGWYVDDEDEVSSSIFEDSDDFYDEAQEFLNSIPNFSSFEAGSCTYFLDPEYSSNISKYLKNVGFTEEAPKWI